VLEGAITLILGHVHANEGTLLALKHFAAWTEPQPSFLGDEADLNAIH